MWQFGYSFLNLVKSGVVRITSPIAPSLMIKILVLIGAYSVQLEQTWLLVLFGLQGIPPRKKRQSYLIDPYSLMLAKIIGKW
jgi:hypothetical protein